MLTSWNSQESLYAVIRIIRQCRRCHHPKQALSVKAAKVLVLLLLLQLLLLLLRVIFKVSGHHQIILFLSLSPLLCIILIRVNHGTLHSQHLMDVGLGCEIQISRVLAPSASLASVEGAGLTVSTQEPT